MVVFSRSPADGLTMRPGALLAQAVPYFRTQNDPRLEPKLRRRCCWHRIGSVLRPLPRVPLDRIRPEFRPSPLFSGRGARPSRFLLWPEVAFRCELRFPSAVSPSLLRKRHRFPGIWLPFPMHSSLAGDFLLGVDSPPFRGIGRSVFSIRTGRLLGAHAAVRL